MSPVDEPSQPDEPISSGPIVPPAPVSFEKPAPQVSFEKPAAAAAPADPWAAPSDTPPAPAAPPTPASPYDAVPPPYQPYPPQGGQPVGPWGPPPAGWPQGPAGWGPPPGPPTETNGLAVAAAITGVLGAFCFLWLLGIILGAVALRQIKARNQKGRGMAITGIVAGSLWPVVLVAAVIFGLTVGSRHPAGSFDSYRPTDGHVSVFDVSTGSCFNRDSEDRADQHTVTVVPCEEMHDAEVFGRPAITGLGASPAKDEIVKGAERACLSDSSTYVLDRDALPAEVKVHFFYPDTAAWRSSSSHLATCFFVTGDHPSSGSVRKNSSEYTSPQIVYLNAAQALNVAYDAAPAGKATDHPADYRVWAGQMDQAVDQEVTALNGTTWSSEAAPAVAALIADLKRGQAHWQAAARSTDTAVLAAEIHKGYAYPDDALTDKLRTALGLPSVSHGGSDGSDGSTPDDSTKVI
ncbi:hypothetical protein CFP65_6126 [Kitasatospora sp. MMS16-BH015]|uniref:DUF4190 domain-containing protein n=1 Tax=Kitasatospora sp. MMS16-BH015 TaxID=2018025 RepID=UPI000CA09EBD|nr:DUF4190 domain-containing protein [Kitasatospora sp. MMS16-BH015]AUG80794.1 hypothetical protein CFP65_6126 [Kitasatospora sp. MMS16-BH015]